ncbi:MAG: DUF4388 domain-containing protein [Candidatus Hydrothermales bacterium]
MKIFSEGMSGSLKIFSAPDVLQLISQQRKRGVVYFYRGKTEAAVGFEDGKVVAAYIIREGEFESLENYLVRSGLVSEQDYKTAKEIHEDTGEPIEEILVKGGVITYENLVDIISFKIQEVIDEIITWKEGIYKFEPEKEIYKFSKIKISLPLDSLLMEAAWHQDEWPRIKEKIKSSDMVFKISEKKPYLELELEKDEKKVLKLINGKRTVQDLVNLTGLGKFKTFYALFRLYEMGRIEPVEKPAEESEKVKVVQRREKFKIHEKEVFKISFKQFYISLTIIFIFLFFIFRIDKRWIFPVVDRIIPEYKLEKIDESLFNISP